MDKVESNEDYLVERDASSDVDDGHLMIDENDEPIIRKSIIADQNGNQEDSLDSIPIQIGENADPIAADEAVSAPLSNAIDRKRRSLRHAKDEEKVVKSITQIICDLCGMKFSARYLLGFHRRVEHNASDKPSLKSMANNVGSEIGEKKHRRKNIRLGVAIKKKHVSIPAKKSKSVAPKMPTLTKVGNKEKKPVPLSKIRLQNRISGQMENIASNKTVSSDLTCFICHESFKYNILLCIHLRDKHKEPAIIEEANFRDFATFLVWKENTENLTYSWFQIRTSNRRADKNKHYYYCKMSNAQKTVAGRPKSDFHCCAFMTVTEHKSKAVPSDQRVVVQYCLYHSADHNKTEQSQTRSQSYKPIIKKAVEDQSESAIKKFIEIAQKKQFSPKLTQNTIPSLVKKVNLSKINTTPKSNVKKMKVTPSKVAIQSGKKAEKSATPKILKSIGKNGNETNSPQQNMAVVSMKKLLNGFDKKQITLSKQDQNKLTKDQPEKRMARRSKNDPTILAESEKELETEVSNLKNQQKTIDQCLDGLQQVANTFINLNGSRLVDIDTVTLLKMHQTVTTLVGLSEKLILLKPDEAEHCEASSSEKMAPQLNSWIEEKKIDRPTSSVKSVSESDCKPKLKASTKPKSAVIPPRKVATSRVVNQTFSNEKDTSVDATSTLQPVSLVPEIQENPVSSPKNNIPITALMSELRQRVERIEQLHLEKNFAEPTVVNPTVADHTVSDHTVAAPTVPDPTVADLSVELIDEPVIENANESEKVSESSNAICTTVETCAEQRDTDSHMPLLSPASTPAISRTTPAPGDVVSSVKRTPRNRRQSAKMVEALSSIAKCPAANSADPKPTKRKIDNDPKRPVLKSTKRPTLRSTDSELSRKKALESFEAIFQQKKLRLSEISASKNLLLGASKERAIEGDGKFKNVMGSFKQSLSELYQKSRQKSAINGNADFDSHMDPFVENGGNSASSFDKLVPGLLKMCQKPLHTPKAVISNGNEATNQLHRQLKPFLMKPVRNQKSSSSGPGEKLEPTGDNMAAAPNFSLDNDDDYFVYDVSVEEETYA